MRNQNGSHNTNEFYENQYPKCLSLNSLNKVM
jgi:hypothetical protein